MGATTAISAMTTASTTYSQVVSKKLEGEFAQQEAQFGAAWARLRAKEARIRGEKEKEEAQKRARKRVGSARVALAAQGIEVGTGSALDIEREVAELGAADVLTVQNNAWREAFGLETQALNFDIQGQRAGIAADFAIRQTIATGGATFARDLSRSSARYGSSKGRKKNASGSR